MIRKDYEKAASIARSHYDGLHYASAPLKAEREKIASAVETAFVILFRDDNPNFNEPKFREACKSKLK